MVCNNKTKGCIFKKLDMNMMPLEAGLSFWF